MLQHVLEALLMALSACNESLKKNPEFGYFRSCDREFMVLEVSERKF